ncbi:protein-export membrane protein SecF [Candidatus Woesebacteria bacterium RIFCSPLOWO2_01_FULL_39_61]|uniref:Protein-export membrane protein SecF n=1 Tax=Candidatus Woesebacteria bacterium RIFCSPHIGHO2_02_FULL_39_13 TaxID=1802505 RepID=A0A1F7Z0S4_9BACT|nr:MAG: protein-export membrane protein SecF [Candidatus Woesebacteria bacterium RIFCSPHIGHO2_01_FULL_39_95]OGM33171.1 MAG: protein-export membrane protein SecF [Candidatus Woesebacteria bacterium RIFCSPHIGHO2_02_FULL_39_13]OGM36355.1 MAG: protein-export membrane protein SecF [Candidatus Woesebacteria bacterium RIFCSPHIGHO2_12_FULL_40_20]OGM67993.1 MAG: protein-export membrane protein SecF [Candidatus Woesebacteria bacterium RIFCSPLOWO2_01_FULL_39_61]OGM74887.1 MAG: protein-export membrane prot
MNWMIYRKIYFLLSGVVIGIGLFSLVKWGLKFGIDFRGGTIAEYRFDKNISTNDLSKKIGEQNIEVISIQPTGGNQYLFKLAPLNSDEREKLNQTIRDFIGSQKIDELRHETVGPTIGPELVKKTLFAILIAAGSILLWVAYQFRSIKFGASAILAMFHDSLVLIGLYSLLGQFFGAEVDFLFVTALLTTLSFSVHDTIVVYDRIRESQGKFGGTLSELADKAVTETMVRSLNNSFTIIFMLVALAILGGETVRWFAVALLIGTISGTYSSPFVAVPLLVTWEDVVGKIRLKRR